MSKSQDKFVAQDNAKLAGLVKAHDETFSRYTAAAGAYSAARDKAASEALDKAEQAYNVASKYLAQSIASWHNTGYVLCKK